MLFIVAAVALLATLLYFTDRARKNAVARRRLQQAEARLAEAMQATEKQLEHEQQKKDHAAALTSLVPAIRDHHTRHVA